MRYPPPRRRLRPVATYTLDLTDTIRGLLVRALLEEVGGIDTKSPDV